MSKTDGVMMKNGIMLVFTKCNMLMMNSDLDSKDGTRVTFNGVIAKKNSSQMMLKEGEYMDVSGKVISTNNSKNAHDKNNSKIS